MGQSQLQRPGEDNWPKNSFICTIENIYQDSNDRLLVKVTIVSDDDVKGPAASSKCCCKFSLIMISKSSNNLSVYQETKEAENLWFRAL